MLIGIIFFDPSQVGDKGKMIQNMNDLFQHFLKHVHRQTDLHVPQQARSELLGGLVRIAAAVTVGHDLY